MMAAVCSKNTRSTEWRLRAGLISAGLRGWRYQAADLPSKPDFVFPRRKLVMVASGTAAPSVTDDPILAAAIGT
jgi:G:T-mismatch repair DNA endonuclease (very short patch repair protein)